MSHLKNLEIRDECMTTCPYICSRVFQMSAISRVFGLQLCTLAVLLMLYLVKGFIYLFIAATKIRAVTDTGDRSLRALLPEEDEERGIVANRSLFPLSFSRVERASPADIECDQAPTGSGTRGRGQ